MAGLKDMLSKGVASVNVKTSNFMETNKIKTYINTLQDEINTIQNNIGVKTYQMWSAGEFDISKIEQELVKIKTNYEEITNQEIKIKEIEAEANKILGNQESVQDLSDKIVCPSCGRANGKDSRFCVSCGTKLQD